MRRVVVTGMGIVSSIGNNTQEVLASLREGKSGVVRADKYAELGFRCQVHGEPKIDWESQVPRKPKRFMEAGVGWNYIAMDQAIRDAGLEPGDVVNERTGIIMGSGGPSTRAIVWAADTAREKDPKKVGPFEVPKGMCSGPSAALATSFQIKGVNYSISSACSTSAHCIGNAAELIGWGKQDVIFAGGCEELDWTLSVLFDAMGAMSSHYNDTPAKASRAYDKNRDGFVIAGGAGVVVLEELEHAKARGAKIYGELVGYGATSDGFDMVAPSGEGAVRCMRSALSGLDGRRRRRQDRLHQSPRDGDAGRRLEGDRGHPRGLPQGRAADLGHEVIDRPFARRDRCSRGDLLAAHDEQRFHLRERQHRGARSRVRGHADRPRSGRTMSSLTVSCRTASVSVEQMQVSCFAA